MITLRRAAGVGALALALLTGCQSGDPGGASSPSATPTGRHGHGASGTPTSGSPTATLTGLRPTPFPVGLAFGNSLFDRPPRVLARQLDAARSAGATWIRIDVSWASLQPDAGSAPDWQPIDRIVRAATSRHLQVLGILTYTPDWARTRGCTAFGCPPSDPARFARFAGQAAQRYGDRMAAWEIWNEPNLPAFWSDPDAAAYASLLSDATAAIRSADPRAAVISGGLGPGGGQGEGIDPARFLSEVCGTGACADLSGIGVEPYTYPYSPDDADVPNAWTQLTRPTASGPSLTQVLAESGLSGLPLWVTAVGAPTGGRSRTAADGSSATLASPTDHVTPAWQAQIVGTAVSLARADPTTFGAVFVYTLDDTDDATVEGSYGLRTRAGTPKPALASFSAAAG